MEKLSPLEQNAAKQLESFDPFANLPIPGFSLKKYERDKAKEAEAKKQAEEPKKEEPVVKKSQKEKKPTRKAKLESVLPPEPENIKIESQDNPIIESRNPEGMPSYRCEFSGRDIFVGFLSYKATNPVTALILTSFALDFGRDKIRFDLELGDKKTHEARNRLVDKFLQTDARWMLMIDDDIIPSIGRPNFLKHWVSVARNVLEMPLQRHIIHKLIGNNKSIVGTAYFNGHENSELVCSDKSLAVRARHFDDALVQVEWTGTGSLLVHRRVFEDIKKSGGEFFDANDASFFSRAKKVGHDTFIDLSIPTFHVGMKAF